ncbi:MAG: hypothetical protein HFG22_18585 [Lachnospiraceae bacterium]|nr:hypothetical protein [Lachnospiraceae bacterium]
MGQSKDGRPVFTCQEIELHLQAALTAATPDVWSRLDLTIPQEGREAPVSGKICRLEAGGRRLGPVKAGWQSMGQPEDPIDGSVAVGGSARPGGSPAGESGQRPGPGRWERLWARAADLGRTSRRWGAAAAACICLVVTGGGYYHYNHLQVASCVEIDVNPSLRLSLNRMEKVLQVQALNEDGARLIEGSSLKGQPVGPAVGQVVDALVEQGYLGQDGQEHAILVSVSGKDMGKAEQLKAEVSADVESVLTEKAVKAVVYDQTIQETEALKELAQTYQVSVGKAGFVDQLISENEGLDPDSQEVYSQLLGQTMEELTQEIGEKDYQVSPTVTIVRTGPKDAPVRTAKGSGAGHGPTEGDGAAVPVSGQPIRPDGQPEEPTASTEEEGGQLEEPTAFTEEDGGQSEVPTDPADPTGESREQPEDPTVPAEKEGGQPEVPTDPADPADPTGESREQSEDPTASTEEEGGQPEAPTDPADPAGESREQPEEPTASTEEKGGQSEEAPTDPIDPADPAGEDREQPEDPTAPAEEEGGQPEAPADPADPPAEATEGLAPPVAASGEGPAQPVPPTASAGEGHQQEALTASTGGGPGQPEVLTAPTGEGREQPLTTVHRHVDRETEGQVEETEGADIVSRVIRNTSDEWSVLAPGDIKTRDEMSQMTVSQDEQSAQEAPVYASEFMSHAERRLLQKGPGAFSGEVSEEEKKEIIRFGPGFAFLNESTRNWFTQLFAEND